MVESTLTLDEVLDIIDEAVRTLGEHANECPSDSTLVGYGQGLLQGLAKIVREYVDERRVEREGERNL